MNETASTEPPPSEAASAQAEPTAEPVRTAARPISPWVIAPFSGAVAAALVIAVGWMLGWPPVQSPAAAPEVSAATVDALGTRVSALEQRLAKASATVSDPAVIARLDTLEKSASASRADIAGLRAQADKLAFAEKAAPAGEAAPAVDMSDLNQRIDRIERTLGAQAAVIAQTDAKAAAAKSPDDRPLRRVVAAALLDVAVRHGDPYAGALAAAKVFAPDAAKLKPLDAFAATGVPNPPALDRELLALVPKLSPAVETQGNSGGIVDRLKAGASNLVRIERTNGTGNDRSAVVARVTAAALRNDFAEARRELASLDAADRAPAQAWLDKVDARDAALAASRQFADDSMSALGKSAQ